MIVYSLTICHNDETDSLIGVFVSKQLARGSIEGATWYTDDLGWTPTGEELIIGSWNVQGAGD